MPTIDCLALCEKMRAQYDLTERACLHIIQIGDNPVNELYMKSKIKEAEKWNVEVVVDRITGDEEIEQMRTYIYDLNSSKKVDGIIVQLPTCLSKEDEKLVTVAIKPSKDVDGLSRLTCFTPCTPKGIMYLLEDIGYEGKTIGIIGRGKLVGAPLIDILRDKKCTLICMNSSTDDLSMYFLLGQCDIVISAVGKPKLFDSAVFIDRGKTVVIDAGISRVDGKQVGDFDNTSKYDFEEQYYTPWVNGVGKLTVASLMANVREAHERNK